MRITAVALLALVAGCSRAPAAPDPALTEPSQGLTGVATPVMISGDRFWVRGFVDNGCERRLAVDGTFALRLGDTELLDVVRVDATTLTATVPDSLALGTYDLTVTGPFGEGTLAGAFSVVTVLTTDSGPPDGGMPDGGPGDAGDAGAPTDAGPVTTCSNGLDDDGDTAIDFPADPGCTSAADTDEANTPPVETCIGDTPGSVPPSGLVSGNTTGAGDDYDGTCGSGDSDEVYEVVLPAGAVGLQISTEDGMTMYDTLIYVRDDCDSIATEIRCDDDSGTGTTSMIITGPLAPGTYFVFIDGSSNGDEGQYAASIQVWVGDGAACDPAVNGTRCAPELACLPSAPAPLTCQPAGCAIATAWTDPPVMPANTMEPGSTVGLPNLHAGTCGMGGDGGTRAPELVYMLSLTSGVANVNLSTAGGGTNYDTLVYIRDACDGMEIACDDDSGGSLTSLLDTGALAAGDYFIFVDGFADRDGDFVLTVTITP